MARGRAAYTTDPVTTDGFESGRRVQPGRARPLDHRRLPAQLARLTAATRAIGPASDGDETAARPAGPRDDRAAARFHAGPQSRARGRPSRQATAPAGLRVAEIPRLRPAPSRMTPRRWVAASSRRQPGSFRDQLRQETPA